MGASTPAVMLLLLLFSFIFDVNCEVLLIIIVIASDKGFGPALSGHTSSPDLFHSTPLCLPEEFSDKMDLEALPEYVVDDAIDKRFFLPDDIASKLSPRPSLS
jgi:hypothetical protein